MKPASFVKFASLTLALAGTALSQNAKASGSYTSAGSRAFAGSNSDGDFLLAGDLKILIARGNRNGAYNLQKRFPSEAGIVSGGVLERTSSTSNTTVARICSQTATIEARITPAGSAFFEATDLSESLGLTGPRDLRCAVNPRSGEWFAVNLKTGAATIFSQAGNDSPNRTDITLPAIYGRWTHAVFAGQSFFAFSDRGEAASVSLRGKDAADVILSRAPWTALEPRDTVVSSGIHLLKVGEGQTALAQLDSGSASANWINHIKIPISPCSENAGCGAWIGPNGRWIVAGIWGTYTGMDAQFSRIKVPLVMSDATSAGVALNPARNEYILVGDTEADIGLLPSVPSDGRSSVPVQPESDARRETRGESSQRYVVWLKGRARELAERFHASSQPPKVLFSYKPHSTEASALGDVIVAEGRIPETLPSHWAAVEPQVEFGPILMANEWTPAVRSQQPLPPSKPWWLESTGLAEAVAEIKASKIRPRPMKIAVIDSGADVAHPALEAVFAINDKEIDGNGIDDDANGLVDDIIGYDFILERPSVIDEFGHGTHVAGLLRNRWSEDGLFGGAMNARLKIFRALDSQGKSNSIDLSRAISAAIADRVDLMNCSWGGGPETQVLRDAFAAATRADILIFSSAGNDALNTDRNPQVPKKFAGVFSVGAATQSQTRARFSNWGKESVYLFAPGSDILSSLPDGRYGEKSGTSMASPIAASGAALVAGILGTLNPEWSRTQLNSAAADILCRSSEKNRLAVPNSKCGSLNALKAVRMSMGVTP